MIVYHGPLGCIIVDTAIVEKKMEKKTISITQI